MGNKVRGSLWWALVLGGVVDFCRRLGLDEVTASHWFLVAWVGTIGLVLLTALGVSLWRQAGQSSLAQKRRRIFLPKDSSQHPRGNDEQ